MSGLLKNRLKSVASTFSDFLAKHVLDDLLLAYLMCRVSLRVLGRSKRDSFLRSIWSDRTDLPMFIVRHLPSGLRHRWALYRWLALTSKWEPAVMAYLSQTHGRLFVDVGANIGVYCVKLQNNYQRIIAIEADPNIYGELKKFCPVNCRALNVVASSGERRIKFYRSEESTNLGVGSMFSPSERQKWNPTWTLAGQKFSEVILPAASLSEILEEEKNIDMIKVDVEGAEWMVLEGAEAIMPRVERWLIELHQSNMKSRMEARMRRFGYTSCRWIDANHVVFGRVKCTT